ncbi:hypothetical protein HJC23_011721 [Cyclotella cryptica]|uniref:SAM domain-containing protein n=1 Tax=Cyclotella cryptica TaxID=29204 RepID=A0ABD3QJ85_9STRA|eukprot:CCRYP_004844-RA/>CCRYP_004844-RA protein AED:0.00 eAED:0.00 QI:220/-1/1/1/-1/1/1/231/357
MSTYGISLFEHNHHHDAPSTENGSIRNTEAVGKCPSCGTQTHEWKKRLLGGWKLCALTNMYVLKGKCLICDPITGAGRPDPGSTPPFGVVTTTQKRIKIDGVWGNYVGNVDSKGRPHGKGNMSWSNGDEYQGEWTAGKKEGSGKHHWKNSGDEYEGQWKNGKRDGKGRYLWADGIIYYGQWKNGEREGIGEYLGTNRDRYIGEWKNDKMCGRGKYLWADGSVYEGDFKNGKKEGTGKMCYTDGSYYEGEWKNGQEDGWGKEQSADKTSYTGKWKNGVRVELTAVEDWLLAALPMIDPDDLTKYSEHLQKDGFESPDMLDAYLKESDLDFMKKGHRRQLIEKLNEKKAGANLVLNFEA